MQSKLALKSAGKLDEKNARHVETALKWLDERRITEACAEMRQIQRMFASHPAVVQLRQRLVAVLYGWDEASGAIEAQAA